MQEVLGFLEYLEIYDLVKKRENQNTTEVEDVFEELGIDFKNVYV